MAMVSSTFLSFLFFLVIILISQATAQQDFLGYSCNNDNGNYTSNSAYHTNLNTLLSNISSNTQIDYGFYNFSYGQDSSDTVNAIAMCRGDVTLDSCRICLNDSIVRLTQMCPNQKEALGWYDNCMLRYSNRSIFHTKETSPSFCLGSVTNASDVDQFNQDLRSLLESLKSRAESGNSERKFATGDAQGPDFQTLYGLVQCTPDLSSQQCSDCLVEVISDLPGCSDGKIGGRIVTPSCNFRYENYRFYNLTSDSPSPNASSSEGTCHVMIFSISHQIEEKDKDSGTNNTSRTLIIAIVVPVASVAVLLILVCVCLRMRSRKYIRNTNEVEAGSEIRSSETLQLDFHTILAATNDFSEANKLGQDPIKRAQLSWERRYKIISGIARGLLYLHEDSRLRIIHRDLKASNILLDAEMNSKISDFGMARLVKVDETQGNTSRIVGTFGYMAPEYALHGQFSVKTDVFSFGVLVLEIVSGRKNSGAFQGEDMEDLLSSRPTMATVDLMLNSYSVTFPLPSQPASYMNSGNFSYSRSGKYNSEATRSATSQPNFLYHSCVNSKGNYTTNSTYHKNLISLFSDIISSDDDDTHYHYGFFNSSYGQSYLDRVNAIAMCRGDVGPRACRACLEDSTRLLTRLCPNRKEAIGWYDRCMLRYSYRSIFQHKETGPGFYSSWGQKSNYNNNNGSRELLESLRSEAASGDWRRKFGVGKAEIVIRVNYSRRNERVYGHVQCTPDLTEESCSDCLSLVIGSDIPRCCEGSLRVRVGRPSWNSNLFRTLVIAIIMPIVAFLVLLILVSIYSRLKKLYIKSQTDEADDDENKDSEKFLFDFETIKVATDDFSNANKLGQGGFGLVYKLLPIPKKPAYYVDSSSRLLENESDQEDHIKSVNIEASITELFPR
ncbi:Cysteine-rich receptor-like protein kinase 25 [Senna tora]|uniref:non-specific serine/threonine protein kinase n=1 Tax=Senna tora TaxID=362788 RepID=A0A835CFC3_9FABA|nr:Cysteine-rich receptor-like protein kinase 25 [Senna tora]